MSDPLVAQKSPYAVDLQAGDYWWCACGRSKRQPFCDGSHQGTGITPVRWTLPEAGKVWLCGCKHTGKPPLTARTASSEALPRPALRSSACPSAPAATAANSAIRTGLVAGQDAAARIGVEV